MVQLQKGVIRLARGICGGNQNMTVWMCILKSILTGSLLFLMTVDITSFNSLLNAYLCCQQQSYPLGISLLEFLPLILVFKGI